MRIKEVELQNFKFHTHLKFDIKKQNCLIYGENGTGKSSIYWALYSIFKSDFIGDIEKYKKYGVSKNPIVSVTMDNNSNIDRDDIINNSDTIYFANQDLFETIISNSNDFYLVITKILKKYFSFFDKIYQKYIQMGIDSENYHEKISEIRSIDIELKNFLDKVQNKTNSIIKDLKEEFEVKFEFNESKIDIDANFKLNTPKIILKIDNQGNLKLYFNEAKLKLTAIAIFFALIKENKKNSLKLLVLDDFLTSLDMANRHYIIEYIFKNFKKYQIILLTHNLQFFNLILDWLNTNSNSNKWDIKNIYTRKMIDEEEAVIYEYDSDYLKEAYKKLNKNELQGCGNLIRKEFERIIHELEKMYKIGKKEQTNTIVDSIINNEPIYSNRQDLLKDILPKIKDCKNKSNNMEKNRDSIKEVLNSIEIITSSHNTHLKVILQNLRFYRKIVLNKASHDNPDAEIYRKEYHNSLRVVKELNLLLKSLQKK